MTTLRAYALPLAFASLCLGAATTTGCSSGDPGTDDGGDPGVVDPNAMPGADMTGKPGVKHDMAGPHKGADMAHTGGMGGTPMGGTVNVNGGSVDRLYFAFHGDTRPMSCNDTPNYPTAVIQGIFNREAATSVQFSLDLGDHFFVCGSSSYARQAAEAQMQAYMGAASVLKVANFMTMGNHECQASGNCLPGSTDVNSTTYLKYLKQALGVQTTPLPDHSFNVTTKSGLATFVIVADNAWDGNQQTWLQNTLATADKNAKYTIVARHHPIDNADNSNQAIWQIISAHHYSLFLSGHTHEYKHDTYLDRSGRSLRIGNGGAPLDNGFTWNGYGTVQQGLDDKLYVTLYDAANNMPMDSFSVGP